MLDKIYIKTKIYSGNNSLKRLDEFKNQNIWIICDEFLVKCGMIRRILEFIHESNNVSIFDKVIPDPPISVIGSGVAVIKKINPSIIIAYGGGSAIDTAKGIIYFAREERLIDKVNFIAIPTTSGTGSEVTNATVITDTESKIKHAIFDDILLPDEAILDSSLTLSVPASITANTGMDVLTHALEAYVSNKANSYSDALAEKAVELLIESLIKCYLNGNDIKARSKMHEASNLAGIAFNISGLGINHSLAHQLGGRFHIPHGLANALFLTSVIDYNSQDIRNLKKYAKLSYKIGMVDKTKGKEFAVKVLKEYINSLMRIMKMPMNLKELNIDKNSFYDVKTLMAENALRDCCTESNPRKVNEIELEKLIVKIYQ